MKTSKVKIRVGGKYRLQASIPGSPVIGEVIDVDKYYLVSFVARDGELSRAWFKEKELTPNVGEFSDAARRAIFPT